MESKKIISLILAIECAVLFAIMGFSASSHANSITQVHIKHVDVFYGTGTGFVDVEIYSFIVINGLELTGTITQNLADQIAATYPDSRITDNINSWVNPSISDMDWVFALAEGFSASANLEAIITNIPGTAISIIDTGAITRGTESCFLTSCFTFDSTVFTLHEAGAEVSCFEHNFTKTAEAPPHQSQNLPPLCCLALGF